MRRIGLALPVALGLWAASGAAGDPVEPSEAAGAELAAAWEARLGEAEKRLADARERHATSERALTRARHRRYPRGEALDALADAADDAKRELAAAEVELPELLEQARREGVAPGVLRRYEAD